MSNYDLHSDILRVLTESTHYDKDDGQLITEDEVDWDREIWIGRSIRKTAGQARDYYVRMTQTMAERAEAGEFFDPNGTVFTTFKAYQEALHKYVKTGETGLENSDLEEALDSRLQRRKHK